MTIEGQAALPTFQPAVEASAEAGRRLPGGEAFIAVRRLFAVTDRDGNGQIDIQLWDLGGGNSPGDPKISAIAVFEQANGILTGDVNGDGTVDIADAIGLLAFQFVDGPVPRCMKAADANDDSRVDIADAITILSYLFRREAMIAPDGSRITPAGSFCKSYSLNDIDDLGCEAPCSP